MLASTRRDLDTWSVGQPFALREHTQRITLDVILRAVYGLGEDDDLEEAHHVVDEFARLSDALILPSFLRRPLGRRSPWTRFLRARAELDRLVYQAIADRRAAGDADERDDVLSLLMRARDEDGNEPTDRELRDELVTVVGAGHETTATALAWAMERLLRNRSALDRLRTSLAEGDDAYLDAVIKETLRVRPIIVDVARRATVPFEIAGYTVPAGTLVLASIAALHYRPDLYEDPSAFRPERWLNGAPDSYAWIPFGGGVRRCLGAAFAHEEMKIVLREIVLRADLRAVAAEDEKPVLRNITLAPKHGAQVMLAAPLRAPEEVLAPAAAAAG
jgi:cytochrome P450